MRIPQLTFTRFIAALAIVIYHYGRESFFFKNEKISFIFEQADLGVSYFFILSGFVMMVAYNKLERVDFKKYLANRLIRIYPAYFLAGFLTLAASMFTSYLTSNFVLYNTMLQTWFPGKALSINYPGWSLSIELFFYVSFPFLFNKVYRQIKIKRIAVFILGIWIATQIFANVIDEDIMIGRLNFQDLKYHPLLHFNEFLAGNLAGLYFMRQERLSKNYFYPILALLITLVLTFKFAQKLELHHGLLAIIFVPLIILMSLSNDRLTLLFRSKPFEFLGEISFGIYIFQAPVWLMLSNLKLEGYFGLHEKTDGNLCFFIRLIILIGISAISYVLFEKPIRERLRRS
ncbi:acyltransferase family protein [Flavobacterium pallidum]|uniref:acyltransferase family protein n=1 Tax=Flavobacterium pallidum TaxID=2172098 RepID=UPI0015E823F2|nr:acyltransferase [Flavobacterium pallidum]